MNVEVLLGLGSNVKPRYYLPHALQALQDSFGTLEVSPVYESAAVGFVGAPFFNLVVAVSSDHSLPELIKQLKDIEDRFDRDRTQPKYSDRTLDIDVLTYGERHGWVDGILLPRSEVFKQAFVLRPLAELRPNGQAPGIQPATTWLELWHRFTQEQQDSLRQVTL